MPNLPSKYKDFVNTTKKLLKIRNFTFLVVFHMKTTVCLKHSVRDCTFRFRYHNYDGQD